MLSVGLSSRGFVYNFMYLKPFLFFVLLHLSVRLAILREDVGRQSGRKRINCTGRYVTVRTWISRDGTEKIEEAEQQGRVEEEAWSADDEGACA
jgi:hypothetical protein